MFVILWESTPLRYTLEPERNTTYLVHAADKLKPMCWPTAEAAQAVLDADVSMPKDKAKVVPLSVYEAIMDARNRKRSDKPKPATEVTDARD